MKIGNRIKHLRKEQDMSQAELAKKIGISRSYLSELESDKRNVGIDTVQRLADKLGVTPSYLLEGTKGKEDYVRTGEADQLVSSPNKIGEILNSEYRSESLQSAVEELSLMSLPSMSNVQVKFLADFLRSIRMTSFPAEVESALSEVTVAFEWALTWPPTNGKPSKNDKGSAIHGAILSPTRLAIEVCRSMESAGYVMTSRDRSFLQALENVVEDNK